MLSCRGFLVVVAFTVIANTAPRCQASVVVPVIAQAGAALVQPGGIQGLANQQRPEMVQAEPQADPAEPAADGAAAPAPTASPFEIRYLIAYVLMLVFIGGGTGLVIRPTGRIRQDPGKNVKK
jgi:hypothetical protein